MQLNELAPLFKLEERACAGDGIIDDGDEADRCYVLLQGETINLTLTRTRTRTRTLNPNPNRHPHPNRCYVLLQGSASVRRGGVTLMTHHSHDDASGAALCPLFGEQALLEDADMHPHTAAVVAAGSCKLLVLYR